MLTELCPYNTGAGQDRTNDIAIQITIRIFAFCLEIYFPRGMHIFLYLKIKKKKTKRVRKAL